MKRMLAMLMVGCLWITPLSVHAGGTDQTEKISEESAVESCIEEFFYSFENIEGTDDVSERMSDIEELSVLDEVGRYEAAGVSMTVGQRRAPQRMPLFLKW